MAPTVIGRWDVLILLSIICVILVCLKQNNYCGSEQVKLSFARSDGMSCKIQKYL